MFILLLKAVCLASHHLFSMLYDFLGVYPECSKRKKELEERWGICEFTVKIRNITFSTEILKLEVEVNN